MNIKLMALGLAPAFALAACGSNTDTSTNTVTTMESPVPVENLDTGMGNAMMADASASLGQSFANTAAASDMFEIEAGRLAQQKATSQALKDFGGMMVTGHTQSTEKLKAAAAKAVPAIVPNPALNADQEANLATLRDATGADFDTAYKSQQVAAHEKALAAMKDYAANGEVAELKTFASDTSKVVKMHLDKIKGM